MRNKTLRILLVISIMACAVGCIADYLLLYSPRGNYHHGDYVFLLDISPERMMWGHYLGILFIPFELLGFWVLSKAFKNYGRVFPLLFFAAITYIMFPGVVYHGLLSFVAALMRQSPDGMLVDDSIRALFEPLAIIMGFFFFIFTLFLVKALWDRKVELPRWLIFFNPALIYVLVVGIYFLWPLVGNYLMVAGFNFANGVFLSACAFALWNESFPD